MMQSFFSISLLNTSSRIFARAKPKLKQSANTKSYPEIDLSDAPKEMGFERFAYFWNRFMLQPGEPPVETELPWKDPEERPEWLADLCEPYETLVDPRKQIDVEKEGTSRMKKLLSKQNIKQKNLMLKMKDYSVLKHRKPRPH